MTWESLDWEALDRLRAGFLSGAKTDGPYWKSRSDLEVYDLTYAERIGWKWDAVLRELRLRHFSPEPVKGRKLRALDWGCGSGVAGRRVIDAWGESAFERLSVFDHSPLAQEFARDRARTVFPRLKTEIWTEAESAETIDVLIVSHVLNELPERIAALLRAQMLRSRYLLWVEPGTHEVARQLQQWRDELRSDFRIIAPCTHAAGCGLRLAGNEQHWCHHFAPAPNGVFSDRNWVKFGQRAGIDLRSLPYSFLVLAPPESAAQPGPTSRVIGRPQHFKPYARVLNCDAEGVCELNVMKRTTPALFKHLDKTRDPLLFTWSHDHQQVIQGHPYPQASSSI